MKSLILFATAILLTLAPGNAQEAPAEGLGLIPELPEPGKRNKKGKLKKQAVEAVEAVKKSATEQAGDELATRIRFREVKTRASQDPKIQAEWDQAQAASTDPDKRTGLAAYYNGLYDRMLKIDPKLKPQIQLARTSALFRLERHKGKKVSDTELEDLTTTLLRD